MVDPADNVLHLKLPLLALTLALWMVRVAFGVVKVGNPWILAGVLLFVLIIPGVATLIGILGNSLPPDGPDFQLMKEFSVLLLIPVISSERIDLTKHIIRWSFVVAIFTLALVALSIWAPTLFVVVRDFFVEKDNAFFRSRSLLGLGIGSFYYKTVGVLVFPMAYFLRNLLDQPGKAVSLFLTATFIAAMLCSDSRATAIAAFLVMLAFLFKKIRTRFGMVTAFSILFIIVLLPTTYFVSFFRSDESSNAAKLGHLRSYAVEFDVHPTYLLWGQGADTEFYTEGFQAKTALTELTYVEMIRWFGIPLALLMLVAIFFPAVALVRRGGAMSFLAPPYIAYLWESASNPLLICSTGLLIVGAVWGVALAENRKYRSTSL